MRNPQTILTRSFWTTLSGSTRQSLLCSKLYSITYVTYGLVYCWGHIVVSLSALSLCELADTADDICHGLCMLLAQCGRSRMLLSWCWRTAFELPWSEPRFLLWYCIYWDRDVLAMSATSGTPLHWVRRHAEAFYTRRQLHQAFSMLLWGACIQSLAGHFLFSADIGLEALLFLAHNIFEVLAKDYAPKNLLHSISVLRRGFSANLFVIVAEWLQASKVFVALVYVIIWPFGGPIPLVRLILPLLTIRRPRYVRLNVMPMLGLNIRVRCINESMYQRVDVSMSRCINVSVYCSFLAHSLL